MGIHGTPAEHQANSFASWLICNGFQDRNAAEMASRSLDVPRLKPLWSALQRKMPSTAGRANVPATNAETASDPLDPKMAQEEKLNKLTEQVQGAMQQLNMAQVCIA